VFDLYNIALFIIQSVFHCICNINRC